jgi:type I restriction enzyme S subunit
MRTKNVQSEIDLSDVWSVNSKFVKRSNQYLQAGDLLVSSANSWNLVGKCCWVPKEAAGSTFGGFISTLRPDRKKVEPRYLYHWFSSDRIQATVRSFGRQTTNISNLDFTRCLSLPIPLPSLGEQQRIARALDGADTMRTKRRQAISLLDDLAQAIFIEMFGHPDSNPQHHPMTQLKSLAKIGSGSTPSRQTSEHFGGTIPWVKTTEVNGRTILDTEEKITESGRVSARCKIHPINSLVIALYGQGKTRGQCAILGLDATTNQACAVIPPNPSIYSTEFMYRQLQISYGRLRAMARGGNQANLNLGLVGDFKVLAPPLSSQEEYSRRIEILERVKSTQLTQLAQLDALFASLQHRAFRGEL